MTQHIYRSQATSSCKPDIYEHWQQFSDWLVSSLSSGIEPHLPVADDGTETESLCILAIILGDHSPLAVDKADAHPTMLSNIHPYSNKQTLLSLLSCQLCTGQHGVG